MYKPRKLTHWIALSMVAGVLAGQLCHLFARDADAAQGLAGYFSIISDIFLRLVKMIIAPLVFATVVSGVSSMNDTQAIGRIALKTLAWFVAASFVSLSIGLLFVNLMQPGSGMSFPLPGAGERAIVQAAAFDVRAFVTALFPRSLFEAMAGNQIVQILIFSLFFGLALGKVTGEPGRILRQAIDGLLGVMLHVTNAVMVFAPLGVFAALVEKKCPPGGTSAMASRPSSSRFTSNGWKTSANICSISISMMNFSYEAHRPPSSHPAPWIRMLQPPRRAPHRLI